MIRYLIPFFVGFGLCLAVALCDCNDFCYEKACRPDTFTDCTCPPGATMQMQTNGTVLCVCNTKDHK